MNRKWAASIVTLLFAIAMGAPVSVASDKSEVVDAVHRYLDNLDSEHSEKLQAALAMCDSNVSILDEFPPHEWQGPTACADWWKGLLAYNEKNGITEGDATLGKPQTVDVSGDHAYFVAPMTYTYKQHGKSIKETASFVVALRRTQAGWRIAGWAYSKQTLE
jgi:SnoaL-like domain